MSVPAVTLTFAALLIEMVLVPVPPEYVKLYVVVDPVLPSAVRTVALLPVIEFVAVPLNTAPLLRLNVPHVTFAVLVAVPDEIVKAPEPVVNAPDNVYVPPPVMDDAGRVFPFDVMVHDPLVAPKTIGVVDGETVMPVESVRFPYMVPTVFDHVPENPVNDKLLMLAPSKSTVPEPAVTFTENEAASLMLGMDTERVSPDPDAPDKFKTGVPVTVRLVPLMLKRVPDVPVAVICPEAPNAIVLVFVLEEANEPQDKIAELNVKVPMVNV